MKSEVRSQKSEIGGRMVAIGCQTSVSDLRPLTSGLARRRRSGVTILEVLFAILVTTVGLLGAVAIFPVASAQARKARILDMAAQTGRAAFHDFDARGMRRPDRWLAWDAALNGGSGGWAPINVAPGSPSPANLQQAESFCIDPRFIAGQFAVAGGGTTLPAGARTFPYQEPFNDSNNNGVCDPGEGTGDYNGNNQHEPSQAGPYPFTNIGGVPRTWDSSLMRRITLRSAGGSPSPMSLLQANDVFGAADDLSYERSEKDKSAPASQMALIGPWATAGSTTSWSKREIDGRFSWMATLSPQFDVSGLPSDNYTLSIVVFHDRAADVGVSDEMKERAVLGTWQDSVAAGGGDIVLANANKDQLKLKPNDWVMVSGTIYAVGGQNQPSVPISRFQWYRVAECDPEPVSVSGGFALNATLIGQDWNTNFVFPSGSTTNRVTLVDGVVAVYEKTVRLEYGSSM